MKSKWINDLKEAHQKLLSILDSIPDDKELTEGWTKKEVIAHISGWYEEGVEGIPQILKGENPTSFRMSIDGYNKRSVTKRKNMSLEEARDEMINLHKKWVKEIESLNEDQIKSYNGTTLGKKQINVLWMINMAIHHDNKHAKALEKKLSSGKLN